MSNIETHIETWKNKLLDLGKRNRLIFYKDTKRSSLQIISPDIDTLFNRLVVKEELLQFPSPIEPINEIENDENDLTNTLIIKNQLRINNGDLQTDITVTEQQKTLRVLLLRSKTAKEEQGVNILYLSFGFLQWKERQDSDQIIKSPLVLVPVNLTVDLHNLSF